MLKEQAKEQPSEELHLAEEIKALREKLTRINSLKYRLLLGIVGGVGTAIGAGVIAAMLFVIISRIVGVLGFGDVGITEEIQQVLNK